ncbi:DctP family TRAP transporter solute-binding subunit [Cytobacillus purgationiresistens]|uniref:C4-dicarboxylate-binding protein DctP n=1 Tax=Cytobacillus purgationiresistens TaxID=863449 RepID=A0ABU0AR50_9BACI|nr:DctP family TRAP transporter solute-binding subunit [Cytobacillus purgationiresistens]MDQ0272883.1 C4-dicarboxylate-binding protein DctP [Cytobacillus purgationiresistens]
MKSKYSLFLLLVIITAAFFFSFKHYFAQDELPYDDDQEGLNEQIVFTFSHVVAENTPKGLAAAKFAELVEKKSNGIIKIVVFPNGSLYSDIEEISALQEGQVDIIAPSTSKLGMISPTWGVLDLPFIFPNDDAINEGLDGPIGESLLQSLQNSGMKGMAHWTNGLKQFTTNQGPIIHPDDVAGQTFRIMQSDVLKTQYDYLNALSIKESFNSTYDLLDSGKVDGEENTISNIYSKKFYNLQKHLTISNHGYLGYAVIMNDKVWGAQSAETKRILSEAIEETSEWNRKQAIEMNKEQLESIKENSNIQIHELTQAEKQAWLERFAPIYDSLAPQIGEKLIFDIKKLKEKYETESTVD